MKCSDSKDSNLIMIDNQYVALLETGDLLFFNDTAICALSGLLAGDSVETVVRRISEMTGAATVLVGLDMEKFIRDVIHEGIRPPLLERGVA